MIISHTAELKVYRGYKIDLSVDSTLDTFLKLVFKTKSLLGACFLVVDFMLLKAEHGKNAAKS